MISYKTGEMMRNNRKYKTILIVSGYLLFLTASFLLYRALVAKSVGMDSLIAFLLSQTLGILILYYTRRISRYVERRRFRSGEYGAFLIINAVILLVDSFLLSTLDVNALFGEMSMQVYGTFVTFFTNVVLHIVQAQERKEEAD